MHEIHCACGAVRGEIRTRGLCNHVICYCPDCRAFARFLGRADTVLDAQGGTEIVQLAQPRISFTRGTEHLAVIRLNAKGILRWYAGCCNTPIGNTLPNPGIAVIGLVHTCLDGQRINEDFGSHIAIVNTSNAPTEPKPRQHGLAGVIARGVALVAGNLISGRYRQSPFFDASGAPRAVPHVLDAAQRKALKQA